MWDLIVSVPNHCLSFYFTTVFDRPIVLGGSQRYVIELDEVNTMAYS